ncbi:MAG: Transcriptional regulator, GntR family [uncultured Caballeronia sp.]|nr:MAG: Transcriptional regulator, GntR family [uncultured Caballeronia sp.]
MSDTTTNAALNAATGAPNGANAESIAENIRAAILEHRLAPGAKLTEAQCVRYSR